MDQSCGIKCCLGRAEQFALLEINEPAFTDFCPLVQRYGELINDLQARRTQERAHHWSSRRCG